ncbi:MAG TPA: bifunctional phosphoribosylaminoimidazolecarboxamide formyltransferase/IMP cyclohydrolase [Candidatus Paceibacterota bacterium]
MSSEAGRNSEFPEELVLRLKRIQTLRYGENPHQDAALYEVEGGLSLAGQAGQGAFGIAQARQIQGKELSYNNIADADAALGCVSEFEEPAAVVVKHMNPCGAATALSAYEAYLRAFRCDETSAFGGIVALNSRLTANLAAELVKIFLEVVIAPDAEDGTLAILAAKPNVRVLLTGSLPHPLRRRMLVRSIEGGVLVQTADSKVFSSEGGSASGGDGLKMVTKRAPTTGELADLVFAFTIVKHVKSNAIVFAKNGATVGIGAGQMSRIYSAKIAAMKAADAKLNLEGSVMASDAFMPFPDCVQLAAKHGVTAIIQPGGSLKDQDSIDAADAAGMAMVFTGIRHFRH